jgi:hypothetical protein
VLNETIIEQIRIYIRILVGGKFGKGPSCMVEKGSAGACRARDDKPVGLAEENRRGIRPYARMEMAYASGRFIVTFPTIVRWALNDLHVGLAGRIVGAYGRTPGWKRHAALDDQ